MGERCVLHLNTGFSDVWKKNFQDLLMKLLDGRCIPEEQHNSRLRKEEAAFTSVPCKLCLPMTRGDQCKQSEEVPSLEPTWFPSPLLEDQKFHSPPPCLFLLCCSLHKKQFVGFRGLMQTARGKEMQPPAHHAVCSLS